jgi:hypothetical protein
LELVVSLVLPQLLGQRRLPLLLPLLLLFFPSSSIEVS